MIDRGKAIFGRMPDPSARFAICTIPRDGYGQATPLAFQHAILLLYPCWSWFKLHPRSQAILVDRYRNPRRRSSGVVNGVTHNPQSSFLKEMISVFEREGVVIWRAFHHNSSLWPDLVRNNRELQLEIKQHEMAPCWPVRKQDPSYWFFCPSHAHALANAIVPGLHHDNCPLVEPRIGLLNRGGSKNRFLGNPLQIVTELQKYWKHVDLAYFERKPFVEQLLFMTNHDILISPTGAQLSLVFALPRCGSLLMLIRERMLLLLYFTTLAVSAGATASILQYPLNMTVSNGICLQPSGIAQEVEKLQDLRQGCVSRCMGCMAIGV